MHTDRNTFSLYSFSWAKGILTTDHTLPAHLLEDIGGTGAAVQTITARVFPDMFNAGGAACGKEHKRKMNPQMNPLQACLHVKERASQRSLERSSGTDEPPHQPYLWSRRVSQGTPWVKGREELEGQMRTIDKSGSQAAVRMPTILRVIKTPVIIRDEPNNEARHAAIQRHLCPCP